MYSYEIHFYDAPSRMILPIEETFADFAWHKGFAPQHQQIAKSDISILFKFTSQKPFTISMNRVYPSNLLYVLLGKEQFFARVYYECLEEDVDPSKLIVHFVSHYRKIHKVTLGEYSELSVW